MSTSAVVIHYEEALYQVYVPLPFTFNIATLLIQTCLITDGLYIRVLTAR